MRTQCGHVAQHRRKPLSQAVEHAINNRMSLDTAPDLAEADHSAGAPPGLADLVPEVGRRRRGRPKGLRKSGGRRKPEVITAAQFREMILADATIRNRLFAIARGHRVRCGPVAGPGAGQFIYPSPELSFEATKYLYNKVLATLHAQAVAVTADVTADTTTTVRFEDMNRHDLGRRMAFGLGLGDLIEKRAQELAGRSGYALPQPHVLDPEAAARDAERRTQFALHMAVQGAADIADEAPGSVLGAVLDATTPAAPAPAPAAPPPTYDESAILGRVLRQEMQAAETTLNNEGN